jgi:hypothetical protein
MGGRNQMDCCKRSAVIAVCLLFAAALSQAANAGRMEPLGDSRSLSIASGAPDPQIPSPQAPQGDSSPRAVTPHGSLVPPNRLTPAPLLPFNPNRSLMPAPAAPAHPPNPPFSGGGRPGR